MKKFYEWISKHKVWAIIICAVVFALPLITVHALFKCYWGIGWLVADWESGDVLAYIAGFESLIGTVMLGAFSLWQNERFKAENDKSQERLEKMSDEQAKALQQILLIDKSANIPLIDFRKSPNGDKYVNLDLFLLEDDRAGLRLYLTNITEYPMKDIHVQSLELFTYGIKYTINESESTYNPHKGLPGHYDTHVAFSLLAVSSKDMNEHFESACPFHTGKDTLQQDTTEWATNTQFILRAVFEIENIYGKVIRETIVCEFRLNRNNKANPLQFLYDFWNKELTFDIVEESDHGRHY